MSKPSDEELESALHMAIQMRENEMDPFFLAKTLLSHNYRLGYLEKILKAADRYVNMGMAEKERTDLMLAIEKAKDSEFHTAQQERESFGLE
ncbi:MAG: hypothetical protein KAS57_08520 [Gammaproteobacteria bacterium]|nr:hypothetical protein [Gammaproteobacteria bacterium]